MPSMFDALKESDYVPLASKSPNVKAHIHTYTFCQKFQTQYSVNQIEIGFICHFKSSKNRCIDIFKKIMIKVSIEILAYVENTSQNDQP